MLDPHATCAQILDALRKSGLTYTLQETPYSVNVTIRKKFIKEYIPTSKASHAQNDLNLSYEEVKDSQDPIAELKAVTGTVKLNNKQQQHSIRQGDLDKVKRQKPEQNDAPFDILNEKLSKACIYDSTQNHERRNKQSVSLGPASQMHVNRELDGRIPEMNQNLVTLSNTKFAHLNRKFSASQHSTKFFPCKASISLNTPPTPDTSSGLCSPL